jgi:2-iminobutanoate/2-iminopropanoate deaminase
MRTVIQPPTAGLDVGKSSGRPSSTIVRGGDFLFVAGLTALDPADGRPLPGTAASEAQQILSNVEAILESAGSSLDKVVKVNVLLASMLEAPNVNEVFEQVFADPPPARTMCGARLPDGAKVVIECTALA